ncbi:hypothetical protein BpJC7_08070 [Weizmannia acidilactici]|uniref:Uncharacterized protein n=1 Tax=Weizmannia acidilactici TaxID=2607726 RepID=A0A5J4JKM8_9BACI|nr:hypothetical protein BpJC4_08210 [Weizmannia acidilactici]GER69504.1 hypothetical protein BpJC7_08070 [Weizmannia acidilactici]GER73041.1 hypothetical protein BpPP18_11080 [Weizmannia acidilactici]
MSPLVKIVLTCTGLVLFLPIGYFLYNKDLGAIPFLILSFLLFYLAYRLIRSPGHMKARNKNSRKGTRG